MSQTPTETPVAHHLTGVAGEESSSAADADRQSSPAVEIQDLSKSYPVGHVFQGRREALRHLNLRVHRGEIFGYLGPNGAGKTTTLKILMGLLSADSGRISVLGLPHGDRAWRFMVGYLPENPYFYDYLTAREYLEYVGWLFGMPRPVRRERARMILESVGLTHALNVPLRRFSKGMVQRAGIAQALMNDPELVVLDEPMSGLDPFGRRLVRDVILRLKAEGKTVLFSTHILPDAETLCDRVGLLKDGRLLNVGRLDEILRLDVSHMEVLVTGLEAAARDRLPASATVRVALGERWRLEVAEGELGSVITAVDALGGRVLAVHPVRQSLEQYFFEQVGGDSKGRSEWLAD